MEENFSCKGKLTEMVVALNVEAVNVEERKTSIVNVS